MRLTILLLALVSAAAYANHTVHSWNCVPGYMGNKPVQVCTCAIGGERVYR